MKSLGRRVKLAEETRRRKNLLAGILMGIYVTLVAILLGVMMFHVSP